jgi:hypothetical protein
MRADWGGGDKACTFILCVGSDSWRRLDAPPTDGILGSREFCGDASFLGERKKKCWMRVTNDGDSGADGGDSSASGAASSVRRAERTGDFRGSATMGPGQNTGCKDNHPTRMAK